MLAEFQVGEEVEICQFGRAITISTIEKLTKTQAVLSCGSRARLSDGRILGTYFHGTYKRICKISQEALKNDNF
jgi:hypothetical protein